MMLHRHFEKEQAESMTKLEDVNKTEEFVSEIFPPDEAPKRRGRPKKDKE